MELWEREEVGGREGREEMREKYLFQFGITPVDNYFRRKQNVYIYKYLQNNIATEGAVISGIV